MIKQKHKNEALEDLLRKKSIIRSKEEMQILQRANNNAGVAQSAQYFDTKLNQSEKSVLYKSTQSPDTSGVNLYTIDVESYDFYYYNKDSREGPIEYITSGLYNILMPGRTPIYGLSSTQKKNGEVEIEIRSNYLPKFVTIEKGKPPKLDQKYIVPNFEKTIIASVFCAEIDLHSRNLGISNINENSEGAAKVDHGKSATDFADDADQMIYAILNAFNQPVYKDKSSYDSRINISPKNILIALDEICNLSEDEIEESIKIKTHQLEKAGYDFKKLDYYEIQKEIETNPGKKIKEILEDFLITKYKKQLIIIKEVRSRVRAVDNLCNIKSENIKLNDYKEMLNYAMTPLEKAILHNRDIQGKLDSIKDKESEGYEQVQSKKMFFKVGQKLCNPISYAVEMKMEIANFNPIEYFMKQKDYTRITISDQRLKELDGKKIHGDHLLVWVVKQTLENPKCAKYTINLK
ncbi:MAG: hypothetical protein SFT91_06030, partial [Rickettsiaceae bacterium]|nr:hypothetical protein [Rickettsiaceae bacterium]